MPRSLRSTATRVVSAALVAATALTLSGCGGSSSGSSSNGVTTISFWDNNGGPTRTPYYQELIKRFEAANPSIKVDYLGLPADSVQQKYDTAIAGGGTPDIGGVQQSYVAGLIARNALEPIDDVADSATLKGNIDPKVLDTIRSTASDKKLYMLPVSVNLDILWYRSDEFAAKKLTPPNTWDDFFTAAQALTDPAANTFGFSIRGGAGGTQALLSIMYAYSGVQTSFDSSGKSTINDPKNVEAIEKIAALYGKETSKADVTNGYKEMSAEFDGGTAAMMVHNLGSYADHQKNLGAGKFAAEAMPAAPDGTRTLVANAPDGFAVFQASQHKAEAKKFLEFMLSKDSNSYWNQNVGQLPSNLQAQKDAWVQANPALKVGQTTLAASTTHIVDVPRYLPQYGSIVESQMGPKWQQVLLGKLSAKDFADQWADLTTKAQADWVAKHPG
ncbi:ABC transporter substrate-binding protein [Nakamurella endophytica]|uniref:Sugar-binding protein n=1 Tax=Nakamurella endophytica TaxID=1748367 RepID=A0A917SUW6_9ACTN|nr:sugar ABC transporter substrate-binding protein [Nakamurella endophytica]GGL98694.1 sugar-binding protein [Nakamurella endophytica]